MYYSHACSYCHKVFYVYERSDKYKAAERLYLGIRKHLEEYDEDDKEYKFDDGLVEDSKEIYGAMTESKNPPPGSYIVK